MAATLLRPLPAPVRLLFAVLVLLATMLLARSAAAQTCTLSNFVANPSLPSTLRVLNNYAVGDRVFATTVTANWSCSSSSGSKALLIGPPTNAYVNPSVASGLVWRASANQTTDPGAAVVTVTSGTSVCQVASYQSWLGNARLVFSTAGSCSGTVQVAYLFVAASASPSGTIPTILPQGIVGQPASTGWLDILLCSDVLCSTSTYTRLAALQSTNAITLSTITSSCTLSSTNLTVVLPTVSPTAFAGGVGTQAGRTFLPLSVTCPSGLSSTGLSLGVTYSAAINTATNLMIPGVMRSTGTATGVGVRIMDNTGAAITSASAIRLTNAITAGTYSPGLSVAYVSTAATVGAGTVNSTATIFLEYY